MHVTRRSLLRSTAYGFFRRSRRLSRRPGACAGGVSEPSDHDRGALLRGRHGRCACTRHRRTAARQIRRHGPGREPPGGRRQYRSRGGVQGGAGQLHAGCLERSAFTPPIRSTRSSTTIRPRIFARSFFWAKCHASSSRIRASRSKPMTSSSPTPRHIQTR